MVRPMFSWAIRLIAPLIFDRMRRMRVQVYCMKCRGEREISKVQKVTLKNGRSATRGKCPVCGTTVFRIVKAGS